MNAENVVKLNSNMNVYDAIMTFLERKKQNSENTAATYLNHIQQFFRIMKNKEINHLTEQDLIYNAQEVESYQVELRKKFKTTTVNAKMSALSSLYGKLKQYGFNVDPIWFDIERYKQFDKEAYDSLSHDEVCSIIEFVSHTRDGQQKALFIRIAYATAFRKEEIRSLTWNSIINVDGQWCLEVIGKGNKYDIKKISDEIYDELMLRKTKAKDNRIFTLEENTITKMMNKIRDNFDFGRRNITFHSFKKASINRVGEITNGDVKAMQRQGNHSSSAITLDNYVNQTKLDGMIIVDVNHNVDDSAFLEMSADDLLQLVLSMDQSTKIKMLQKAKLIQGI